MKTQNQIKKPKSGNHVYHETQTTHYSQSGNLPDQNDHFTEAGNGC